MIEVWLKDSTRLAVNEDTDVLGSGAQGTVYSHGSIAIKCPTLDPMFVDPLYYEKLELIIRERFADNFRGVAFPRGMVFNRFGKPCGLYCDLVSGSVTLHDLRNYRAIEAMSLKARLTLMLNIVRIVKNVHQANRFRVVMGDMIKPPNIMIDTKHKRNAVFIDADSCLLFGFQLEGGLLRDSVNFLRTPGYTAPELLQNTNLIPSHESDVFSLACVLFLILHNWHPYEPAPCADSPDWDLDKAVLRRQCFRYTQVAGYQAAPTDVVTNSKLDEALRMALLGEPYKRPTAEHLEGILEYSLKQLKPQWLPSVPRKFVAMVAAVVFFAGSTWFLKGTVWPVANKVLSTDNTPTVNTAIPSPLPKAPDTRAVMPTASKQKKAGPSAFRDFADN